MFLLLNDMTEPLPNKIHTVIFWVYSSHKVVKTLFQQISEDDSKTSQHDEGFINVYKILGERGWDLTRLYLGYGPWRCEWEDVID